MTAGTGTPPTHSGVSAAPAATVAVAGRVPELVGGPVGTRTGVVLVYLGLALAALTPGLALKFGFGLAGWEQTAPFTMLRQGLAEIRFGGGLRFWLGVSGATMIGLLLLYPVRKALVARWRLGSVAGWFHLHLVLGLAGPVAVLYHCNFGLGSTNSNMALLSMAIITVSGFAGHFVHASASAKFYAGKLRARQQLDAIGAALGGIDAMHRSRQQLLDELEAFEAGLLTPRQGVLASLRARWLVERRRRHFMRSTAWLLVESARHLGWSASQHMRMKAMIGRHLDGYVRLARHASSRSVREQIWARWRLFHLPVFLLMIATVTLHVAAVWNMDAPGLASGVAKRPEAARVRVSTPEVRRVTTVPIAPSPIAASEASAPVVAPAAPVTPAKPVPVPVPVAPLRPVEPRPKAADSTEIEPVYADLKRFSEAGQSGTGAAASRTLAVQLAELKAKWITRQFRHMETETGFALTGKHLKLDCTNCHTVPLREVRSTNPRQCIVCHSQDDVHRDRRPACAECHTTNRWSEIKPK